CEGQTNIHAAAIPFDWRVDELAHFRELHDFIELPRYFFASHSEDVAIQEGILATSKLRMKTCSDFEQTAHASVEFHTARGWLSDAGEYFEKRGFSSAVATDYADHLTPLDIKTDVAQGPDCFSARRSVTNEATELAAKRQHERFSKS